MARVLIVPCGCRGRALAAELAAAGHAVRGTTRSPELEAQNDIDDITQMIEAQNEIRRRRGLPDRDEAEIEESVRRHREELAEQARRFHAGEE